MLSFDRVFEWLVDNANARRALVINFQVEDFGGSLGKMRRNLDNVNSSNNATGSKRNAVTVQELMRWRKSYQHAILEDDVESFVGDVRHHGESDLSNLQRGLFSPDQLVSLGLSNQNAEYEQVDVPGSRLYNRLEVAPRLAKPVLIAGAPGMASDARIGALGNLLPGAFSREGFERFLVVDALDGDTLVVEAETESLKLY